MDEKTVEYYESKIKQLRECVGSWRRLAQGKASVRECVREGYDYNDETHYKVFAVNDVPTDLPMPLVLDELKDNFLKEVYPFKFERVDYDERRNCWLVRVFTPLNKEMRVDLELVER